MCLFMLSVRFMSGSLCSLNVLWQGGAIFTPQSTLKRVRPLLPLKKICHFEITDGVEIICQGSSAKIVFFDDLHWIKMNIF